MKSIYIGLVLMSACSTQKLTRQNMDQRCPALIGSEGYHTYWHCIKNCGETPMVSFGIGLLESIDKDKFLQISGYEKMDPAIPQEPIQYYFRTGGVTAREMTFNDLFGPEGFKAEIFDVADQPHALTFNCHEIKIGNAVFGFNGAHDFLYEDRPEFTLVSSDK